MNGLVGQRRHAAKISRKLSVEFVYTEGKLDCVWDPDLPERALSAEELDRYRVARDTFMASLATDLGGEILIVEC